MTTGVTDKERSRWIEQDALLQYWWKGNGYSKDEFIKRHRAEIDKIIVSVRAIKSGERIGRRRGRARMGQP